MATDSKLLLTTQPEKPNHYRWVFVFPLLKLCRIDGANSCAHADMKIIEFHCSYLKEFRVEQCSSFLQHKCNQHRPFVCFNWHFMNQRRRRPVRKRDGTFNYSADNYCVKYDETTGICPDGDEWVHLNYNFKNITNCTEYTNTYKRMPQIKTQHTYTYIPHTDAQ